MANKKLIAAGVIGIVVIGALLWASKKGVFLAAGGTNSDSQNKGVADSGINSASVVVKDATEGDSLFWSTANKYFNAKSPFTPAMQGGVSGQWLQGYSSSLETNNEPLTIYIDGHSGN